MEERAVTTFVREYGLMDKVGWQTSARALVHLGLYVALTLLGFELHSWLAWAVAWTTQSIILVGMFSAVHEGAHGHLYRSKRANRIAGVLCANLVLINFSLYRALHLQHHRFTRVEGDSELNTKIESLGQYALSMFALLFTIDMWLRSMRAIVQNEYP